MTRPKRSLVYHHRFKELPVWTPDRIRMLRLHLGMTQKELAEALSVRGAPTVCEWEVGRRTPVRSTMLMLTILADEGRFPIGVEYESKRNARRS